MRWWRRHLIKPPPASLRERSAAAVAASWTDGLDVKKQMIQLGDSDMALVFKAEVAVHLKGHQLVAFILEAGGLESLMHRCWPEVFQRLLTSVYLEIGRFDQKPSARQALSKSVQLFREATETRSTFHPAVHRLGLTGSYDQTALAEEEDVWLLECYRIQDSRRSLLGFCPPLTYPLPHSLRLEVGLVDYLADCSLAACEKVSRTRAQWRQEVSASQQDGENKGLVQSEWSARFRRESYPSAEDSPWRDWENASPNRRRLLLLRSMVMSHLNEGQPQVMVAAFLALTDYGYAGDSRAMLLLRPFRMDVYRYLARALSAMHAVMDLPLACLAMMKKGYSEQLPMLCLGDWARLALTQLEILVRYGLQKQARDLFWFWYGRWPSRSWLHEEWVMIYAMGVLQWVQESLLEIHITQTLHQTCGEADCEPKHQRPLERSCKTKILCLKSIFLRCLSDLTLREDFRRDCNNGLLLCQLFDLMLTHKKGSGTSEKYREFFKSLRERLLWNQDLDNSPHLEAMVQPVVFFQPSSYLEWLSIHVQHNNTFRVKIEELSLVKDPRVYPDHLFSLVVLRFHYPYEETPLYEDAYDNGLVRLTKRIYSQVTGDRHHRIALLKQWIDLSPQNPTPDKGGRKKMSLVKEIQIGEFLLSTMRDCLKGFSPVDLASDENFCMYLRRRDSSMVVWLEAGLRSYRFAPSV